MGNMSAITKGALPPSTVKPLSSCTPERTLLWLRSMLRGRPTESPPQQPIGSTTEVSPAISSSLILQTASLTTSTFTLIMNAQRLWDGSTYKMQAQGQRLLLRFLKPICRLHQIGRAHV